MRKTALVGAFTALVLFCMSLAPAAAQNLLRNGGFEGPVAGDAPQGWSYHDFRGDELVKSEVTDDGEEFGDYCLKLESPGFPADYTAFCLPVDVTDVESDELLFSCSYRTKKHPQALVTLAAYDQDFTEREFQTPGLHSVSHPLGETEDWHGYTTRMQVPEDAQQVVVYLRIMGEGQVWWDGVSLRPVGGEIQAELDRAGIIHRMPDRRLVRCSVQNVTRREMPLRLEIETSEADSDRRRREHTECRLAPGEDRKLEIDYRYEFDRPHRLRVTLKGEDPSVIHMAWERDVPGLVDATITEPAFRNTILSSVPTEQVIVEGTINAVPQIARQVALEAMIVGTGERSADVEHLSDEGMAGPWRLQLPATGMLTQKYIVDVTGRIEDREHVLQLPVVRAAHSDAETAYDSRGRLWVNGEPIFPVGIYRVERESDLPVVADAGCNFVITPSRLLSMRYADAAQDAGVHVMLASDTMDGQFWEYMARKYYGHPAMIGWNGLDLPDTKLVTFDTLYQAYRKAESGPYPAIAEADEHHPIALALRPTPSLTRFAELADIVMAFSDPVPRWPITAVADSVRTAREAVGEHKPVWAVIQSSGNRWVSELTPTPQPDGRPPTAAEHRAMVYLALMAGADGIVYHAWSLPAIGQHVAYHIPRDQPDLWEGMIETNRQLEWLAPTLMKNDPEPVELAHQGPVRVAAWDSDDAQIVVAVNTADTTAAIGFDIGAAPKQEIKVLFERRCVVATDSGEVGDIFEPYDVHIYEVAR